MRRGPFAGADAVIIILLLIGLEGGGCRGRGLSGVVRWCNIEGGARRLGPRGGLPLRSLVHGRDSTLLREIRPYRGAGLGQQGERRLLGIQLRGRRAFVYVPASSTLLPHSRLEKRLTMNHKPHVTHYIGWQSMT